MKTPFLFIHDRAAMGIGPSLLLILGVCLLNAGCVIPLGQRSEVEIDPFQAGFDERARREYQRQGLSEEEAKHQVFEDRLFESIEEDRRAERYQRNRETQRRREFEQNFYRTMERERPRL